MKPRAFVGSAIDGRIWRLEDGTTDAGSPIAFRVESNPVAPAGLGMDCTFDRVWITLTHAMPATLVCTPIVDDVVLEDAAFSLVLDAQDAERARIFERTLRRPFMRGGSELYRFAPRGTWFSLRIEAAAIGNGRLFIDQVLLEHTVRRPTKERAPA